MVRPFLFCILILVSNAQVFAQTLPGGPVHPNPQFDVRSHNPKYSQRINELLEAFSESWKKCGKGKSGFTDLKILNAALVQDQLKGINLIKSKEYCNKSCLFNARVKKAIHEFNQSNVMAEFLVANLHYSKSEAKAIVASFQSYE